MWDNLSMDFLVKYKSEIDLALRDFFAKNKASEKNLQSAMKYGALLGGKRIRPILGLLAFEISKNSQTKVLRQKSLQTLLSLELIHASSLVHDDLPALDYDELRRGIPTVWKKFGEANAILAGDALLNLAFENLAQNAPSALLPKLVTILGRGCGGMLSGQVRDLDSRKNSSLRNILKTHSQKTGELILASVRFGATLANANPTKTKLLENFAQKLGLAFQIKDDLLDATGNVKVLGKKVGKDIGKKGFVKILGIEKSQKKLEKLIQEAIKISQKLKSRKLENLAEFVLKRER